MVELIKGMEELLKPNGVFIAALSEEYAACWLRDQLLTSLSYYYLGDFKKLKKGFWVVFDIFHKHRAKIMKAVRDSHNPFAGHIHAKYHPDTLEEITPNWGHHQLDALGLFLWLVAYLDSKKIKIIRNDNDLELVYLLGYYLQAIKYWQSEDFGMWEEGPNLHSSSIGAVLAGFSFLKERKIIVLHECIISRGQKALDDILPGESSDRSVDMAQLSLIWPYKIVSDQTADVILKQVKESLVKERGLNRYPGDSYHAENGASAEWPMGFFWLSIIASQRNNFAEAEHWFKKGLNQINSEGHIPELYKNGEPNENKPLGWAHSFAIIAKLKLGKKE
ncbi:hypothetical protein KAR26_01170 [Candidatus Parcubacteria bacterium]|nr:hypothetical protein [Candidatus Parcubacteria bacterium]